MCVTINFERLYLLLFVYRKKTASQEDLTGDYNQKE